MVDGAAAVLLLRSEKQLALLSQMQDMGGIAQGGVDIMGDHDDCQTGCLVDPGNLRIETAGRNRIKPRHRFIQKDHLLCSAHSPCQQHTLLLTAGEVAVTLVLQFQNLQRLHIFPGTLFFCTGIKRPQAHPVQTAGQDHFPDTCGEVLLDLGLLREIADFCRPQALTQFHLAGGRLFQAQQSLDQRALACAVFPDNTKIISFLHGEIQISDHRDAVIGKGQVFTFQ